MTAAELEALMPRYARDVARRAARIAEGDADLCDDLAQEGWIALWSLDAERAGELAYVRAAVAHRMWVFRRWEGRGRTGIRGRTRGGST